MTDTFINPFLLAIVLDIRPPSQPNEYSACHIFNCPKVNSIKYYHEDITKYFIATEYSKE